MTDLTEQWRKGELTGEYWCEITESPYPEQVFLPTCDEDIIVKVLAKVPSYDEYRTLKMSYEYCPTREKYIMKLEIKNAQLKELLKECGHIMSIEKDFASCHFEKSKLTELLTKIDEVLR